VRWLLLACAIVCEVFASLSLEGAIDHPWLYVVVGFGYLVSFWLFGRVLRAGMPVGTAYAIWGAVGVALTAVLAAIIFDEYLSTTTIIGLVVVIAGVVVINLGGAHGEARPGSDAPGPDEVERGA